WPVLAFTSLLPQRILWPPFRLMTAITHEIEDVVLRRWQGVQRFSDPPLHQQMDIPGSGLEQTAQVPAHDPGWRPADRFFRGLPPWIQGLHTHQPIQEEAVPAFPDTRHPAKPVARSLPRPQGPGSSTQAPGPPGPIRLPAATTP